MISHNGRVLARVENGALEFEELICAEAAVLFYALKAMPAAKN